VNDFGQESLGKKHVINWLSFCYTILCFTALRWLVFSRNM